MIGIVTSQNDEEPCDEDYRVAFNHFDRIYDEIEVYLESEKALDEIADSRIQVTLGISGETVTLRRQDNGTYTLNGDRVTSGASVVASNGNEYRLQRTGDGWTAVFVPPPPDRVELGRSGNAVFIHYSEDRSSRIGGTVIRNGHVMTTSSGNRYMLTWNNGTWIATYQVPMINVPLGASGSRVTLERSESGIWWQRVSSGHLAASDAFVVYRLVLSNGTWTAVPVESSP